MFGSRRQFLASIAASLAAAPFVTRRAWSAALGLRQDAAPLRLILWPALNGADHKYFWPNGEDFNVCTEPLKAHRSKITFLRGLNIEGSFNHFAIRSIFTGAPIADYLSPDPTVKSIDQEARILFRYYRREHRPGCPCSDLRIDARRHGSKRFG